MKFSTGELRRILRVSSRNIRAQPLTPTPLIPEVLPPESRTKARLKAEIRYRWKNVSTAIQQLNNLVEQAMAEEPANSSQVYDAYFRIDKFLSEIENMLHSVSETAYKWEGMEEREE